MGSIMAWCSSRYFSGLLPLLLPIWLMPSFGLAQSLPLGESGVSPLSAGPCDSPINLLPPTPLVDDTPCPPAPLAPQGTDLSGLSPGNGSSRGAPPPPLGALSSQSGINLGIGGAGGGGIGGAGLAFNPIVGQLPVVTGYRAADYFNAPVRDQDAHLGYFQQNLSLLTPIWQCPTDEVSATANVGVESFNTNAILPDSQQHFPFELWNIAVGSNYRHLFDNGWIGGGGVSIGSRSDRPFENINVMSFAADAFLRLPQGEKNAWIFSLSMSSNSQILPFIPIPGIAYFYAPSRQFQALVGFPFANVNWMPSADWSVNVTYALLTNFRARVSYRLARQVRLFAAIDFDNQNYYLADRPALNDRFFLYYDRLSSGVQVILGRQAFFDLSGGYVFGRRYYESTNGLSGATDIVNVGPGAYVAGTLQFRF
jgi:hypothetical protein